MADYERDYVSDRSISIDAAGMARDMDWMSAEAGKEGVMTPPPVPGVKNSGADYSSEQREQDIRAARQAAGGGA